MASPQMQALFDHVIEGDGCDTCSAALIMYGIFCVDCRPDIEDRVSCLLSLCEKGETVFVHKKIDVLVGEGKLSPFAGEEAKKRGLAHRQQIVVAQPGDIKPSC